MALKSKTDHLYERVSRDPNQTGRSYSSLKIVLFYLLALLSGAYAEDFSKIKHENDKGKNQT